MLPHRVERHQRAPATTSVHAASSALVGRPSKPMAKAVQPATLPLLLALFLILIPTQSWCQEAHKCEESTVDAPFWTITRGCIDVPHSYLAKEGPKTPVYYEISRPKEKPLGVILNFHGGPGYPRAHIPQRGPLWEGMLAHYTFIYFHQRGSGWSGKITDLRQVVGQESLYSLDTYVDDARYITRRLEPDSKVVVFGKSAGGFLAMLFAVKYPEMVSGAIVACSGPDGDYLRHRDKVKEHFTQEMEQRFRGFTTSLRRARARLASAPPPALAKLQGQSPVGLLDSAFFDLSYSLTGQYEMVSLAREAELGAGVLLAKRARKGAANIFGGGLESGTLLQHISCRELGHGDLYPMSCIGVEKAEPYDVKPRLKELAIPVLVLSGRYDSVLPLHFQEAIVRNLSSATVSWVILRWSGHMIFQEQPRASSTAILRFLGVAPPLPPQDWSL